MENINERIETLIKDESFRALVVNVAVTGVIPVETWNNDKKLQSAIYYKFAMDLVNRIGN